MVIPECPLGVVCFTAACNEHDRCYVDCERGLTDCNDEFYADLLQACDTVQDGPLCENLAYIYWQATERFGSDFRSSCCPDESPGTTRLARISHSHLCPFVDADDDLLPDEWELGNGLDPRNSADALLDLDGNGLTRLEEYLHGSDQRVASESQHD